MLKRNGEWYAHFVLKKEVESMNQKLGIDLGERNVATAVAISKQNPKPMKGLERSIREIRDMHTSEGICRERKDWTWLSRLVIRRKQ